MKKLLTCAFLTSIILAGCSSSKKEEMATCKTDLRADGLLKTSYQIHYSENEVSSIVIRNEFSLTKGNLQKDELLANAKGIKKIYSDVKGINYSYTTSSEAFDEVIEVKLTKKTVDGIKKIGILGDYIASKEDKIEAKKMIKQLKEDGMDCK